MPHYGCAAYVIVREQALQEQMTDLIADTLLLLLLLIRYAFTQTDV
jgi:hypothetical protein